MHKKIFLDDRYIIFITFLILALYIGNVSYLSYVMKNNYTTKIISTLGAVSESYGNVEKEIVDRILSSKEDTYLKGINVLKKNGYYYSGSKIIEQGIQLDIISISGFLFLSMFMILLSLYLMFRNHIKNLINIENYIDDLNNPMHYINDDNKYTKNIYDKLHKLSVNAEHTLKLLYKEKEKMYDFVQDLSHQMKTPLAITQLYVERFLYERDLSKTDKLELGLKQIDNMTVLINTFLKLGMLQSNNVKLELKNTNVCAFVEDVIEDIRLMAEHKNIDIIVHGNAQDFFLIDDFWMKEALINLLKNSVEHSPDDKEVKVKFYLDKHGLNLHIIDQGSGIEESKIPKIFDRFVSSVRQKDGSNGLGLSIAKQAVIRHFGEIFIKNNQTCGVTFVIRLPILKGKEVYNPYIM